MKKVIPILGIVLGIGIGLAGVTYGFGYLFEYPLPLLPKQPEPDYSAQNMLMSAWDNVRIYQMKEKPDTVEEIIKEAEPETIIDTSEQQFYNLFPEIDKATMNIYLQSNQSVLDNGYGMLFLDYADKNITPTGIKTQYGDDILTIDVHDNLMIVGVSNDDGSQVGKLVILKNPKQLSLEMVNDINYWEKVSNITNNNNGILGVPASGYNYFETGRYFTVKGMLVKDGETIRKSVNPSMSIGLDEQGILYLGESVDVENIDTAIEAIDILIKDGSNLVEDEESAQRLARVAIGQSLDNTTYMLVTDGSDTASQTGFTLNEAATILEKYGAVNAASLIGGNRASLYWNSKVLNNGTDFEADNLLVPNAFVISAFDGDASNIIYTDFTDTTEQLPEASDDGTGPEDEKGPGALAPQT